MTDSSFRVALVQMNSQDDLAANLAIVRSRVAQARQGGATLVVLPENFALMGASEETRASYAESLDASIRGPILTTLADLARQHGVIVIGGGMPEASTTNQAPYNTCVVIDSHGSLIAKYRKIHLFDVDVSDGQTYRESASTSPGSDVVVATCGDLRIGLSICYDVRFPELYRKHSEQGANVLVVPAAFTLMTGKDHWRALLQARAIENQCYVLAAAQWGTHPKGRTTYGKSMVVDPWGDVIAQAPEREEIIFGDLNLDHLARIRQRLPALHHRKILLRRTTKKLVSE